FLPRGAPVACETPRKRAVARVSTLAPLRPLRAAKVRKVIQIHGSESPSLPYNRGCIGCPASLSANSGGYRMHGSRIRLRHVALLIGLLALLGLPLGAWAKTAPGSKPKAQEDRMSTMGRLAARARAAIAAAAGHHLVAKDDAGGDVCGNEPDCE